MVYLVISNGHSPSPCIKIKEKYMKTRLHLIMDIDKNSYRELADFESEVNSEISRLAEKYNVAHWDAYMKERRGNEKPDIRNMTLRVNK